MLYNLIIYTKLFIGEIFEVHTIVDLSGGVCIPKHMHTPTKFVQVYLLPHTNYEVSENLIVRGSF